MGHFLIIRHDFLLPCCIHNEWRISLRFFAGELLLPCGIALMQPLKKINLNFKGGQIKIYGNPVMGYLNCCSGNQLKNKATYFTPILR